MTANLQQLSLLQHPWKARHSRFIILAADPHPFKGFSLAKARQGPPLKHTSARFTAFKCDLSLYQSISIYIVSCSFFLTFRLKPSNELLRQASQEIGFSRGWLVTRRQSEIMAQDCCVAAPLGNGCSSPSHRLLCSVKVTLKTKIAIKCKAPQSGLCLHSSTQILTFFHWRQEGLQHRRERSFFSHVRSRAWISTIITERKW